MDRDVNFYSELKQMNEDVMSLMKESNLKSPYFDFTPTFQDYIEQMKNLEKRFPPPPPQNSNSSFLQKPNPPTSVPQFTLNSSTTTITPTTTSSSVTAPTPSAIPTFTAFGSAPSTIASSIASPFSLSTTSSSSTIFSSSTAPPVFSATPAVFSTSNAPIFSASSNPPAFSSSSTPFSFSFTMPKNDNQVDSSNQPDNANDGQEEDAPPPEPKIDRYEEPNAKHAARCKLYEKGKTVDGEVPVSLIGIGFLYVKELEAPNKLQVIVRQEPDLRRVLLNEVVTSSIPVKLLPKAVQMIFPNVGGTGQNKFYIAKLKDENEAQILYNMLNLASKQSMF